MPELVMEGASLSESPSMTVERTLAVLKPDAVDKAEEIVEEIKENGFTILQQRRLRLSPEQATDFYAEHYGKMFFPSLIKYIHRWEKAAAKNGVEDYHEFY